MKLLLLLCLISPLAFGQGTNTVRISDLKGGTTGQVLTRTGTGYNWATPSAGGGGSPTGAAGGALTGTYPNPGLNSTTVYGLFSAGTGTTYASGVFGLSSVGTAGTYGGGSTFINSVQTDASGRVIAVTTGTPAGGGGSAVTRLSITQAIGNNSTNISVDGYASPNMNGNTNGRAFASTNAFTRARRVGISSFSNAGGANTGMVIGGQHNSSADFTAVFVWGAADPSTITTPRSFVGFLASTTNLDNVSPLTLTNMVGVGHEQADANLSVYVNDGAGNATKVALGSTFPANTVSTDAYRLVLTFTGAGTSIAYTVTNLTTAATTSGTFTTNLPTAGSALTAQFWRNGGGNGYPTFDFMHFTVSGDL